MVVDRPKKLGSRERASAAIWARRAEGSAASHRGVFSSWVNLRSRSLIRRLSAQVPARRGFLKRGDAGWNVRIMFLGECVENFTALLRDAAPQSLIPGFMNKNRAAVFKD